MEANRNLAPLAKWIEDHRMELVAANDGGPVPLEFMLHKLRFMSLLVGGGGGGGGGGEDGDGAGGTFGGGKTAVDVDVNVAAAVAYGRAHLSPFAHTHTREIQRLMGAAVFAKRGLETSPYADLLRGYSAPDEAGNKVAGVAAVSYTHLTLPTILLV